MRNAIFIFCCSVFILLAYPIQGQTSDDSKIKMRNDSVRVMPYFQGKPMKESIGPWAQKRVRYPQSMLNKGVSGRVVIQFRVDTTGMLVDMDILESPHEELSRELLRVLSQTPRCKPALDYNGNPIDCWMTVPARFSFAKKSIKDPSRTLGRPNQQYRGRGMGRR